MRGPVALIPSATAAVLAALLAATPVVARQGAAPAKETATEKRAADSVRAATIRDVTAELSAPDMEGRGTGTPGGERAAHAIADRFTKLGLEPGGDAGTYFQAIPFKAMQVLPTTSFTVGGQTLVLAKDFVPTQPFSADDMDVTAPIVCVGYGVANEELKRDDFAGIDVKGKIALVLTGRPTNVDEAAWGKVAGRQAVVMGLVSRGAAAVVFAGLESARFNFDKIGDYLTRRTVALGGAPAMPIKLPPILIVGSAGAEKLVSSSGTTFADLRAKAETGASVSRDLGVSGTLGLHVKREEVTGHNVIGILGGSDPTLKSQAVLFTAHYDAFGRGLDGRIYPGAADNALGVGEIIAIAEAAAKGKRPRRTMIFMSVCGEEAGLLGAKYWAEHPTWPLESVAANVNFDGIGTEVYGPVKQIVGFGAEYSSLGTVLNGVAAVDELTIVPDPMPQEKAFYRSDHYMLVQKGVPALMLLGGPAGETAQWIKRAQTWLDTDYHQPTDVIRPDWNWEGARTLAALGLVVALRVAAADAMPEWLPTSPFKRPAAPPAAAAAGAH